MIRAPLAGDEQPARDHLRELLAARLQILATRAELKALRVRINPHFLFNSLSAIAGLISKEGQCSGQRPLLELPDNGPGIEPAKDDANGNGSGFGLRNFQDRLQLRFGHGAGLRLTRAGSMTSVSIGMPAGEPSTPMEGSRV